jgi:hypothetical protein
MLPAGIVIPHPFSCEASGGVPRNVIAMALIKVFGGIEHRQQHSEDGLPRL